MTDYNELRRRAEAVKSARAALVGHVCTYEDDVSACQSKLHDDMISAICAFDVSPDVVLGLLDRIEELDASNRACVEAVAEWGKKAGQLQAEKDRLKGECDFFSARSEEERTNRGLAEKDFHDAMELVRKYSAERDEAREAVKRLVYAVDVMLEGARDCDVIAVGVLADPVVKAIVEGR